MQPIIKNNLEAIVNLCKLMEIEQLYLIGSAARNNDFTNLSDLDFLYKFKKQKSLLKFDYFDVKFGLEKITQRKVDLIAIEKITNKYFLEPVEKEKIKLYECE